MECVFGLVGDGFTILGSDMTAARSIVMMKADEDRTKHLSNHVALAYTGEKGDAVRFTEYIQRNVRLYSIRNGFELSVKAIVNYTRTELADYLRSKTPYSVNMLICGWDKEEGAQLYWIDYLASSNKVKFGAHGYGSYFILSIMDRHYRKGMSLDEAMILVKTCLAELKQRFIINFPKFLIKIIDKDGIRIIEL